MKEDMSDISKLSRSASVAVALLNLVAVVSPIRADALDTPGGYNLEFVWNHFHWLSRPLNFEVLFLLGGGMLVFGAVANAFSGRKKDLACLTVCEYLLCRYRRKLMRTRIQKWGNSLAVRIPNAFVKEAGVEYGTAVDLSVDDGKIIIDPNPEPEYRLENLLRGVTKRNLHAEVETGGPAGGEVW
jgi:antitoxin MazE